MAPKPDREFDSIYTHGFVRAAVCVPLVRVADPAHNAERTLELARRADEANAAVALFPELGLSAYSNDDLFQQDALLDAVMAGLQRVVEAFGDNVKDLKVGEIVLVEGPMDDEEVSANAIRRRERGRSGWARRRQRPPRATAHGKRPHAAYRQAPQRPPLFHCDFSAPYAVKSERKRVSPPALGELAT